MIWLICSLSFLSRAAMMSEIVCTTSSEMTVEYCRACSASVWTAVVTASRARSDFGLNSFSRSFDRSVAWRVVPSGWTCASAFGSTIALLLILRFRRRRQRLQDSGILEDLAHQFFGAGLAVHVRQQVRQLRACFEQLVERAGLSRDRGGREIVEALERDVDAQIALPGERVRNLESDPRVHGLEAIVEVVDVDLQELAVRNLCQRFRRIAGEIRHDPHHEGQLDLLLGPVELHVVLDLHAWRAVALDELLTTCFGHGTPPLDTFRNATSDRAVRLRPYASSPSPRIFSTWGSPSGARSRTISMKFFDTRRFARRISIGTGLDGSCLTK